MQWQGKKHKQSNSFGRENKDEHKISVVNIYRSLQTHSPPQLWPAVLTVVACTQFPVQCRFRGYVSLWRCSSLYLITAVCVIIIRQPSYSYSYITIHIMYHLIIIPVCQILPLCHAPWHLIQIHKVPFSVHTLPLASLWPNTSKPNYIPISPSCAFANLQILAC